MLNKKILFVDDEEKILSALVRECEYWVEEQRYEVLTAGSVSQGLALIEADPDNFYVVVCDLKMPQQLGTELLQDVQSRFPDISTILLTGFSEIEEIKKAVASGIVSFIQKPWEAVFLRSELKRAMHLAEVKKDRRRYLEGLEQELIWAKRIHRKLLLPEAADVGVFRYSIAYRPAASGLGGGGDFFQILPTGGDQLLFCLGNVDAAGAQGTFHALLVRDLLRQCVEKNTFTGHVLTPHEVLELLNDELVSTRTDLPGCFLNLTAGVIGGGKLTVSSAGGEAFFLLRDGTWSEHTLPSPGLGYKADVLFKDQVYGLRSEDLLLLASRSILGSAEMRAALESSLRNVSRKSMAEGSAPALLNEILSHFDPGIDATVMMLVP